MQKQTGMTPTVIRHTDITPPELIKRYRLVSGFNSRHFETVVNKYLSLGWQPHGQIHVVPMQLNADSARANVIWHMQPLVKLEATA